MFVSDNEDARPGVGTLASPPEVAPWERRGQWAHEGPACANYGSPKDYAYLGRAFKPETWVEFPNDLSVFCGLPLMRF